MIVCVNWLWPMTAVNNVGDLRITNKTRNKKKNKCISLTLLHKASFIKINAQPVEKLFNFVCKKLLKLSFILYALLFINSDSCYTPYTFLKESYLLAILAQYMCRCFRQVNALLKIHTYSAVLSWNN